VRREEVEPTRSSTGIRNSTDSPLRSHSAWDYCQFNVNRNRNGTHELIAHSTPIDQHSKLKQTVAERVSQNANQPFQGAEPDRPSWTPCVMPNNPISLVASNHLLCTTMADTRIPLSTIRNPHPSLRHLPDVDMVGQTLYSISSLEICSEIPDTASVRLIPGGAKLIHNRQPNSRSAPGIPHALLSSILIEPNYNTSITKTRRIRFVQTDNLIK
jgi:hypothetical protein